MQKQMLTGNDPQILWRARTRPDGFTCLHKWSGAERAADANGRSTHR